jgi:hyperosmotically inducible protein
MKGLLVMFVISHLSCLYGPMNLYEDIRQQCIQPKTGEMVSQELLAREIRHELIALPHYSIFDNLDFRLDGAKVTLSGEITSPSLKTTAESAVKSLGVTTVADQIESLPVSPTDDELRLQLFRAIYTSPMLEKYAIKAVPPIHIIVKQGHVTLEGTVGSDAEKNEAEVEATAMPGVVSFKNNLRVEKQNA